jgi:hypothetical protein
MSTSGDASSCIYLIGPDGRQAVEMFASRYEREADFQALLASHPALIDGRQVDPDNPRRWLLVAKEATVPDSESDRWSLDHLFVDQDGVATLVEVKRKSDTRLRREVVGQMLDYAANGSLRWTAAFLASSFADTCREAGVDPDEALGEFLADNERIASFWESVESNLRAGRMRLLFVADEIPAELLRIVEFLNERMAPTEVLALELRYFSGGGYSTHVPRLLGRTLAAVAQKEASGHRTASRRAWDRETFLADLAARNEAEVVDVIRSFLDACEGEYEIAWGTGSQTGSFTPRRRDVSARGPITVCSDGRLDVKPSWLNDTAEARAWRDRVVPRLAALGWVQQQKDGKGLTLSVPPAEWIPKAAAVLDAIR